jgi:NAD(P)-dependent dehydrogenase (short-subunit alcohol dehydrogenase family)
MEPVRMDGTVCLITGATSGIGRATAKALAGLGATVVLVARDPTRAGTTVADIARTTGNDRLEVRLADLSSQASVRELAGSFRRDHDRLDVLVNCAGGFYRDRRVTADGLELTFALNHLAYFVLTTHLLDLLAASAPARVVNVTSGAHTMGRIRFDDLQGERRYRGQDAYSQSKLANVLFTYELARRVEATGVTANCVHPGVVRTNFARENPPLLWKAFMPLVTPFMRTPQKGAETVVWLASSPEVEGVTGRYFYDEEARKSSPRSYDRALAARLWDVSAELTAEP